MSVRQEAVVWGCPPPQAVTRGSGRIGCVWEGGQAAPSRVDHHGRNLYALEIDDHHSDHRAGTLVTIEQAR